MKSASWIKMTIAGAVCVIGGPMLINYVTPTEEELFKKYNPDLQRRSLEGREQRLKEANDFIAHLKEMGKSDKPLWTVWKEQEMAEQQRKLKAEAELKAQRRNIAEEIRKQRLGESST